MSIRLAGLAARNPYLSLHFLVSSNSCQNSFLIQCQLLPGNESLITASIMMLTWREIRTRTTSTLTATMLMKRPRNKTVTAALCIYVCLPWIVQILFDSRIVSLTGSNAPLNGWILSFHLLQTYLEKGFGVERKQSKSRYNQWAQKLLTIQHRL